MDPQNLSRAGTNILQTGGYRAFIPNPLPPVPPIDMDGPMWASLSRADRSLGRLDAVTETLPNPDLFVFMYVRREAVLSSQIEGTQASLDDLLEFEVQAQRLSKTPDVAEVANYVAAMNYGLDRLRALPLSLRLIRETHERLLAGVRGSERTPGEFRRSQNWIGPPGCDLSGATFVPPPVHEMHQALDQLEKFMRLRGQMPDLAEVGLVHAQFETIHPFLDGNGRIGRLLVTLLLCERGILSRPLLYLSIFFKRHRQEYYDRLQAVRESGDWEGWLRFFLRGVAEVAHDATETARGILAIRELYREAIHQKGTRSAAKVLLLLDRLFLNPYVSVAEVEKLAGVSYSNANQLVATLCDLEILREITGQRRNRLFRFERYLALFREADEA